MAGFSEIWNQIFTPLVSIPALNTAKPNRGNGTSANRARKPVDFNDLMKMSRMIQTRPLLPRTVHVAESCIKALIRNTHFSTSYARFSIQVGSGGLKHWFRKRSFLHENPWSTVKTSNCPFFETATNNAQFSHWMNWIDFCNNLFNWCGELFDERFVKMNIVWEKSHPRIHWNPCTSIETLRFPFSMVFFLTCDCADCAIFESGYGMAVFILRKIRHKIIVPWVWIFVEAHDMVSTLSTENAWMTIDDCSSCVLDCRTRNTWNFIECPPTIHETLHIVIAVRTLSTN